MQTTRHANLTTRNALFPFGLCSVFKVLKAKQARAIHEPSSWSEKQVEVGRAKDHSEVVLVPLPPGQSAATECAYRSRLHSLHFLMITRSGQVTSISTFYLHPHCRHTVCRQRNDLSYGGSGDGRLISAKCSLDCARSRTS